MKERTMVKISANEDFFGFRTIAKHGRSPHKFILLRSEWECVLRDGSVLAKDMNSFVLIRHDKEHDLLILRFAWLDRQASNRLNGYEETIRLPFDSFCDFAEKSAHKSMEWAVLSQEERARPKLIFTQTRNLRQITENKRLRRKLVHFLRDHFYWSDADEIRFYDDFLPYSFSFREYRGGTPCICGGLILHRQEQPGKAYYAIHT